MTKSYFLAAILTCTSISAGSANADSIRVCNRPGGERLSPIPLSPLQGMRLHEDFGLVLKVDSNQRIAGVSPRGIDARHLGRIYIGVVRDLAPYIGRPAAEVNCDVLFKSIRIEPAHHVMAATLKKMDAVDSTITALVKDSARVTNRRGRNDIEPLETERTKRYITTALHAARSESTLLNKQFKSAAVLETKIQGAILATPAKMP